jgi:hypothetical protein
MIEELWVHSWQEQEIFSSPKHPDWLRDPPSLLFSGYHHSFLWDVKLSNSLNVVLRLKMRGDRPVLPLMSSWCVKGLHHFI